MNKISNSTIIEVITKLLILLAIAKTISIAVLYFLPADGVELNVKENYQPKYQRVNFKNMIDTHRVAKVTKVQEQREVAQSAESINNMLLKGLYGNKSRAFVIIAMKAKPKVTEILSIGEVFHGYTLKEVSLKSAIFDRNGRDYILYLENAPKKSNSFIKKVAPKKYPKKVKPKTASPIASSSREVRREDISYYANNPDKIWQDISINEVMDGKTIKGFKVTRINSISIFAMLGLKRGDLIISANNVELKTYRDVIGIYEKINDLDTVQIIVIRNNQEMELVYEIN